MSNPHETPAFPTLPALEIPSTIDLDETTGLVSLAMPSVAFLQSPAPSFTESFTTALTSPVHDDNDTSRLGLSPLYPPQNLRKSVSVDSFVQYGRESTVAQEHGRNHAFVIHAEANSPSPTQPWSSIRGGRESLSYIHSDGDPHVASHGAHLHNTTPAEQSRRPSLVSQGVTKSPPRKGHLLLPSRTRNNSTATTPSSPQERGGLPSHSSMSSLPSQRGSPYPQTGRMRSGSLGLNPSGLAKLVTERTAKSQSPKLDTGIVLAVIGTRGCGKSMIIRKGLAGYGLIEVSNHGDASRGVGSPQFIRRSGVIPEDLTTTPPSPARSLEVIELEVQTTGNGRPIWPQDLSYVDGILVCYDSSDENSYRPVESLLEGYRVIGMPLMVLGCKADLEHAIEPSDATDMLKRYDTGLIEVSIFTDSGKEKMKQSFKYMLKAVLRQRGPDKIVSERNPATPTLLYKGSPWTEQEDNSASDLPTVPPSTSGERSALSMHVPESANLSYASENMSPATAQSPTGTQPVNHPFDTEPTSRPFVPYDINVPYPPDYLEHTDVLESSPGLNSASRAFSDEKKASSKNPRPAQWTDLDELLDRLLFMAVSGEDPTFTTHFLLTYRRFTIPRTVLLAMQKRMRQLDNPCGDPMFACFSQMRICHLLEIWIRDFAHDFSVPGTAGALHALIKSIISKTHLLHYGSELLPFLEELPTLVDEDTAWTVKGEITDNDSDDGENDEDEMRIPEPESPEEQIEPAPSTSPDVSIPARERKPSFPLSKSLISSQIIGGSNNGSEQLPKQHIKDLLKLAQEVLNTDSAEIAREITVMGVRQFMKIKPRDWLHYTFINASGKNKGEVDQPIVTFNIMANHLAEWVVSLILCHKSSRSRARQIEKFVDIAQRLRTMNNYSALRGFVAGINNAMDDPTTEYFKSKFPDAAKNLMSWDVLLQQIRSHRAYRLALRNSKGLCIPALEVHMIDLIKTQEGNDDTNPDYPSKIHWGKFNLMGRFITSILQCQAQCRNSKDIDIPSNKNISALFYKHPVMSLEMQKSRLKSSDYDDYDFQPSMPGSIPQKEALGLRRIFFW